MALLRLGDIARDLGKLEEARHFYRKSRETGGQLPPGRLELEAAMRALETEDYLRRKDLDAAADSLNLWQWQVPEEKLRGQWSVLKVRYSLAGKEWDEAVKEAETLVRVNPESQYAPEALLLLADARRRRGETEKAVEALERLKSDYPDSPLVKDAEKKLKELARRKK